MLVRNVASLVSAWTEKMVVDLAQKGVLIRYYFDFPSVRFKPPPSGGGLNPAVLRCGHLCLSIHE